MRRLLFCPAPFVVVTTCAAHASLACALALLLPLPATAAPRYVGAVPRGELSPAVAGVIDAALQAAAERARYAMPGEAKAPSPARNSTSVRELERMLADARGRHLEGDFHGAVDQTEEAARRFLASYAFEEDSRAWEIFTDLLLVQGLARSRLDDERGADDALARIARVRPAYVPDPGIAPPRFTNHFRKLSRKVADQAGSLRVESSPAGAQVILDGQPVGTTPLVLPAVAPGLHHFSLRQGEARLDEAREISGAQQSLRFSLGAQGDDPAEALRHALAQGAAARDVARQAAALGPDVVVAVIESGRGGPELFALRLLEGRLHVVVALALRGDLGDVDAAARRLLDAVQREPEDRWLDGGDASSLRQRLLSPPRQERRVAHTRPAAPPPPGDPTLFLGASAGAVGVFAISALVTALVLAQQPSASSTVELVIDASAL